MTSCKYDVQECPTPTNITYSNTIKNLIANYDCFSCHGPNNPAAGFSLSSYTEVKSKVDDGRLFGAVNHSPGFVPMPENGRKMDQCDINKVRAWIDAGAPNN